MENFIANHTGAKQGALKARTSSARIPKLEAEIALLRAELSVFQERQRSQDMLFQRFDHEISEMLGLDAEMKIRLDELRESLPPTHYAKIGRGEMAALTESQLNTVLMTGAYPEEKEKIVS
jgi:hypothetical protein